MQNSFLVSRYVCMSVHAVVHAAGARVLPEHMTGRYHAKPLMLNDKILLSHSWEQNNILLECDGVKASNLRCIRNFDSVSKDHILGMYVYVMEAYTI